MKSKCPESSIYPNIGLFVDAHVHIHNCFDIQKFFDAAAKNFSFHASKTVSTTGRKYVLCLSESYGVEKFEEISRQADEDSKNIVSSEADWKFSRSDDEECLIANHPNLGEIAIVAGRQIVTAERLEILGLGSLKKWQDGLPAADIIESIADSGAVPVLPWGFGKWLGFRRRIVHGLIEKFAPGALYLGDNSGRPGIMPEPREFVLARELGMRILPGSDPLPFKSEYNRAGSFGFYLEGVVTDEGLWPSIRSLLTQSENSLHRYGTLESPFRFMRNQLAMQYVTRIVNRREASKCVAS